MVPAPHVPPRVGHLAHLGATGSRLRPPPTDGEPLWVVPLPSDDLGQDAAACVDEPVANLGERVASEFRWMGAAFNFVAHGTLCTLGQPPLGQWPAKGGTLDCMKWKTVLGTAEPRCNK